MGVLTRFRRSSRWLVLGTGLACLLVGAVGLAPHEDKDGTRCLVCKARQEPLEALTFAATLDAPLVQAFDSHGLESIAPRSIVYASSSPRAPPA
jgi:hypothetical protein